MQVGRYKIAFFHRSSSFHIRTALVKISTDTEHCAGLSASRDCRVSSVDAGNSICSQHLGI